MANLRIVRGARGVAFLLPRDSSSHWDFKGQGIQARAESFGAVTGD